MGQRCVAIKADGERCGQKNNLSASGECLFHDSDRKRQAQAARRRGAKASHAARQAKDGRRVVDVHDAPELPKTVEDLREWAHFLVWATATGKIDPRTSDSITRAIKVAMETSEGSDLRDRLAELEATLAEVKRTGMRAS